MYYLKLVLNSLHKRRFIKKGFVFKNEKEIMSYEKKKKESYNLELNMQTRRSFLNLINALPFIL